MMEYPLFLNRVIDEGKAAARESYSRPGQSLKLDGSLAGFEACRDKTPAELVELLRMASDATREAYHNHADDYWYTRCFEAEIEWVCNVVSAAMASNGQQPIGPYTARGVLKAADILGTR